MTWDGVKYPIRVFKVDGFHTAEAIDLGRPYWILEAIDLGRPYWILHPISRHTPEAVTTVFKCSWGWTQKASETCRALLQLLINILPSFITLVLCILTYDARKLKHKNMHNTSASYMKCAAFKFRPTDQLQPYAKVTYISSTKSREISGSPQHYFGSLKAPRKWCSSLGHLILDHAYSKLIKLPAAQHSTEQWLRQAAVSVS